MFEPTKMEYAAAEAAVANVGVTALAGDHTTDALAYAAANFGRLRKVFWDEKNQRASRECDCDPSQVAVYFNNPGTGAHGWMCAACRGITQIG